MPRKERKKKLSIESAWYCIRKKSKSQSWEKKFKDFNELEHGEKEFERLKKTEIELKLLIEIVIIIYNWYCVE